MCGGMASASTHNPIASPSSPLEAGGGDNPEMTPATFRQACRHWELLIRWHTSSQGTWKRWAELCYITPSAFEILSAGQMVNKTSAEMSGLSCEGRKQEEAVLLRILEEQRCAEMMAEWLLQVVFDFCNPLLCSFFLVFSFCFSFSFGSHGLAFHFQNRHLIKLVRFLNYLPKLQKMRKREKKRTWFKGISLLQQDKQRQ